MTRQIRHLITPQTLWKAFSNWMGKGTFEIQYFSTKTRIRGGVKGELKHDITQGKFEFGWRQVYGTWQGKGVRIACMKGSLITSVQGMYTPPMTERASSPITTFSTIMQVDWVHVSMMDRGLSSVMVGIQENENQADFALLRFVFSCCLCAFPFLGSLLWHNIPLCHGR